MLGPTIGIIDYEKKKRSLALHTTGNTSRQPRHPPDERLATVNEAEAEELAAAAAAEAEAHRTAEPETEVAALAAES